MGGTAFKVRRPVRLRESIPPIRRFNLPSLFGQVVYFNFSRGVMVDHMDESHVQATQHLKGAREHGLKMAREREDNAPRLTLAQQAQLREYLQLVRETQPEVYPHEPR